MMKRYQIATDLNKFIKDKPLRIKKRIFNHFKGDYRAKQ